MKSTNTPHTRFQAPLYKAAGKLEGKKAIIVKASNGIGRAVAILFAREGADVVIPYYPNEINDAEETAMYVRHEGRKCILIEGNSDDRFFCMKVVERIVEKLGALDILANVQASSYFVKAVVQLMKPGSAIIINAPATDTLTKSLSESLEFDGIRVNAVAWGQVHPQPEEIAPAFVFLASNADSSYINGIILPEIGGLPVH